MQRVEIIYGGDSYTVAGAEVDEVQARIEGILASGAAGWIDALDSFGGRDAFRLLISPGVSVSLAVRSGG